MNDYHDRANHRAFRHRLRRPDVSASFRYGSDPRSSIVTTVRGFAQHLFAIKNVAFTRILMDQGIYVSMLVFAAGLRHLIRQARADSEWIGTLLFGAALGWVAVTVVADGLEGGAVLGTLNGNPDPSAVQRAHCGNAADLQRVDCVCDHRAVPGGGCMGDVRQRRVAALDRMDRRRRRRLLRRLGSSNVRRSGRLRGLL